MEGARFFPSLPPPPLFATATETIGNLIFILTLTFGISMLFFNSKYLLILFREVENKLPLVAIGILPTRFRSIGHH